LSLLTLKIGGDLVEWRFLNFFTVGFSTPGLDNPSTPSTQPFIPQKCNLVGKLEQELMLCFTVTVLSDCLIQG
jgi:hypothetical protein